MKDTDRSIRKKAWDKLSAFFLEHEKELDDIYDKLVKNRTEQARKMGYENYVELGYYRMGRNCYDKAVSYTHLDVYKRQDSGSSILCYYLLYYCGKDVF